MEIIGMGLSSRCRQVSTIDHELKKPDPFRFNWLECWTYLTLRCIRRGPFSAAKQGRKLKSYSMKCIIG